MRRLSPVACSAPRAAFLVALAVGVGAPASAVAQSRPDGLYARIHTTKGRIVARLEPDLVPLAVANFVGLAEGTIHTTAFDPGRPFYDGTVIRRVEPGHVIQTGAAEGGRTTGPGYTFPNEIHAALSHDHMGALNFANGGPDTNASQWCIMLGDRSYLDGDYIVFGDVVEGMDVVRSIRVGDVVDSVRIERVGPEAADYRVTDDGFRVMVESAEARHAEHHARRAALFRDWVAEHHPEATGPEGGVRVQELARADDRSPPTGPVRVRYAGTRVRYLGHLLGRQGPPLEVEEFGSKEGGVPDFVEPGAFVYEPGVTELNPGLDGVLADMVPGDRRVVVVPPELGYGRAGLYPPETPGRRRFVISPNTLLVYDVEMLSGG